MLRDQVVDAVLFSDVIKRANMGVPSSREFDEKSRLEEDFSGKMPAAQGRVLNSPCPLFLGEMVGDTGLEPVTSAV